MEKQPFAGNYDTKVRIYRMVKSLDAVNQRIETPELVCETLAHVSRSNGGEDIDNRILETTRGVFIIRKRPGLQGNEKLLMYVGNVEYNITQVTKLTRACLIINANTTGVVQTPPEPGGECDGVENFVSFITSPGDNSSVRFTFQGGNLLGSTEVVIVGVTTIQMGVGQKTFNAGLNVGMYTIMWRKLCGGQPVTDYAQQDYEVINSGPVLKRLTSLDPLNEDNVQFPCYVGIIVTAAGQYDQIENSGVIANDENDFVTKWNTLNASLGAISNPEFVIFPTIRYWQFLFTPLDYVMVPTAMWVYLIE